MTKLLADGAVAVDLVFTLALLHSPRSTNSDWIPKSSSTEPAMTLTARAVASIRHLQGSIQGTRLRDLGHARSAVDHRLDAVSSIPPPRLDASNH